LALYGCNDVFALLIPLLKRVACLILIELESKLLLLAGVAKPPKLVTDVLACFESNEFLWVVAEGTGVWFFRYFLIEKGCYNFGVLKLGKKQLLW
jgi:hypothetical protein